MKGIRENTRMSEKNKTSNDNSSNGYRRMDIYDSTFLLGLEFWKAISDLTHFLFDRANRVLFKAPPKLLIKHFSSRQNAEVFVE